MDGAGVLSLSEVYGEVYAIGVRHRCVCCRGIAGGCGILFVTFWLRFVSERVEEEMLDVRW